MGFPCRFFHIVHKSCLCTKLRTWMSKESHLNFYLNTHVFLTNISLWISTSLCVIFIVVLPAMLFGTSNNPMCHIFLILSYIYISCLNHIFLACYFLLASVQSLSHQQCLLSHPTHHHKRHLSMADTDTPTTKQTTPPMVSQRLHPSDPAASQPPANSLTSRSLLAACRPMLVLAIAA